MEKKEVFCLSTIMQPEPKPHINDLANDKIKMYVLCELIMEEGAHKTKVLRWSQGTMEED